MEVASPLTFSHTTAGAKRHLSCSPGFVDQTNRSPFSKGFDTGDEFIHQRSFKRRRFGADETMGIDSENISGFPPQFALTQQQHHQQHDKSLFAGTLGSSINDNSNNNTSRTDSRNPQNDDLLNTINAQASEIANLKTEKSNVETSFGNLKSEHDKVLNENRILKRAVTIQQERQNQASNEIEAARQFKISAEERIRTLEQLVLSLRYHLQAQQTAPGNDFMGIPPRPPDVY